MSAVQPGQRELTSDKAQRIVEAMRASVAKRGITGSTFEHVAREAGVSRGLLHYYFGTKERLLVEVVRHDSQVRIGMLDEPLAKAQTVDDVIDVLVASLEDLIAHDPGFYSLLFELFTAGQANAEIRRELGELYARAREHVAGILRRKEAEGVLKLRFDADATVSYMFAAADGSSLQRLTDPDRDHSKTTAAGIEVARFLLSAI
jgi:AcrR family transcriptional regulator